MKKGLGEHYILTSFLVEMVINTSNNLIISVVLLIITLSGAIDIVSKNKIDLSKLNYCIVILVCLFFNFWAFEVLKESAIFYMFLTILIWHDAGVIEGECTRELLRWFWYNFYIFFNQKVCLFDAKICSSLYKSFCIYKDYLDPTILTSILTSIWKPHTTNLTIRPFHFVWFQRLNIIM